MNWLLEQLPDKVKVDGAEYPINTDFRAIILIDQIMHDKELSDTERILSALNIFYIEKAPEQTTQAIEKLVWFFRCDRKQDEQEKRRGRFQKHTRAIDYSIDSRLIWAAFLQEYRIDLTQPMNLHWWKFCALMENLSDNCKISKVMMYRTVDMSGMSKQQKSFYAKMRKKYELKGEDTESTMKLSERNRRMKDYVKQRMKEVSGRG